MTTLYANPYDMSADGFYFSSAEEYSKKAAALRNDHGRPVEEFELEFIDGKDLDADLFGALRVNQANLSAFLELAEDWSDDDKLRVIVAVREGGYGFELGKDGPDRFDVDLYEGRTMRDIAIEFVDEGLFGEVPKALEYYIDYDAIARDLAMDYGETVVAGKSYIYRIA